MDFSPSKLPNNSDLLARIGNFLPKIEAANEELEKTRDTNIPIDCGLVRDDDDDDDDGEVDESSEPTIQLKVQIGEVEKNKIEGQWVVLNVVLNGVTYCAVNGE